MVASGAWKCGVMKAIQSLIGSLKKQSKFNNRVEKQNKTYRKRAV